MDTAENKTEKPASLKKGKYVFTGDLTIVQEAGATVPYLSATAIAVTEEDGNFKGEVLAVRVSDLILKQSSYIDENGKIIEAHKLYIWPRNLGSTEQWTDAKKDFINEFVLNFPIEVISAFDGSSITWKYITPEAFMKLPSALDMSAPFKDFATHQHEYFFLRRPLNEPK